MFKIFKRVAELEHQLDRAEEVVSLQRTKITALEDYLKIEYFEGPVQKPHYRKRKVVVKKVGRPRKNKVKKVEVVGA